MEIVEKKLECTRILGLEMSQQSILQPLAVNSYSKAISKLSAPRNQSINHDAAENWTRDLQEYKRSRTRIQIRSIEVDLYELAEYLFTYLSSLFDNETFIELYLVVIFPISTYVSDVNGCVYA